MKLKTKAGKIKDHLSAVKKVVSGKSLIPILESAKLQVKNDTLYVTGTDLNTSVSLSIPEEHIEALQEGSLATPADKLHSLMSKFRKNDQVTLENKNQTLHIESDTGSYTISSFDAEEFPTFPQLEEENFRVSLPVHTIKKAKKHVDFAVGDKDDSFAWEGIMCKLDGNQLEIVGTDGKRVSLFEKTLSANPQQGKANVPPHVFDILNKFTDDESVTFAVDSSKVMFGTDHGIVSARQIEGNYPDYRKAIPDNLQSSFTVNVDEFERELEKTTIFSPNEQPAVMLDLQEGELELFARSQQYGEASSTVGVQYSRKPYQAYINPNYLLDILGVHQSDEMEIQFGQDSDQLLIEDENFLYLVLEIDENSVEI